ncbi:polyprenol phosphomannose-dependent alpha 1,6 mannosyltransferase MptB [Actinocrispum wychmicini]|uniref:polyprenol phosphomannose-dependent alpha 1,6 mannosyltransferase MptB n=1 Tax=Actinocrispum wychmicini TaxID=1213861 RepID=UPI003C7D4AB5
MSEPVSGGVAVDVTTVPPAVTPLDAKECRQLGLIRRFGIMGSLLVGFGSLGAGAAPVYNPLPSVPVIGLFARIPGVALAIALLGMGMLIAGWLLLGRFARPGRPRLISRAQLNRTLLMWAVPLMFVPPLFSKDVYSYLAQSSIVSHGLDPYQLGPGQALGQDDPLTRGVSNMWRDTPAPYGPLFLYLGHLLNSLTGNHVVTGVLTQRLLAVAGIMLFVWALPRLARRFGVQPVTALWFGAANPLVLFHLVAGVHNESLAIGLMLAGFEISLRYLPKPGAPPLASLRKEWTFVLLGVAIITLGAAVKLPALVAAAFVGVQVARRWGGGIRRLLGVGAIFLATAGVTMAAACFGTGLGFGWIPALSTPGLVRSWMSPISEAGQLAGSLGVLLGLGNHTTAAYDVVVMMGYAAAAVITVWLVWDCLRGRRSVMTGLGASLAAWLILHPAMQPWYLLFPTIPLAASLAGTKRFRVLATFGCTFAAVLLPPTGGTFGGRIYIAVLAYVAAIVVLLAMLAWMNRKIPFLTREARAEV